MLCWTSEVLLLHGKGTEEEEQPFPERLRLDAHRRL
jgi:hypothetical protein